MLHSNFRPVDWDKPLKTRNPALAQRVEALRNRPPADLGHGEALMLQGMAAASLRPQRITGDRIRLDD